MEYILVVPSTKECAIADTEEIMLSTLADIRKKGGIVWGIYINNDYEK